MGALLKLTGVCVAQLDSKHEAQSFEILLRSPEDVVVVASGPWWNADHARWVVGICLIAVVVLLVALAVDRRHSELQTLAMTDALTGLHNRRGFFMLADHQWQVALRKNTELVLFYLDIDCFKNINDTLGHKEGDQALLDLTEILRACFRSSDVLARMGGDEFAVLCSADGDHRMNVEDRLTAALRRSNQISHRKFRLAVSFGMLVCDDSMAEMTMGELVSKADALMYEQKRNNKARAMKANESVCS